MKKQVAYHYHVRETCAECGNPLIGHDKGFDVCGNCEHAILKRLRFDTNWVTCAYCFTERDKAQAPCPRCRLLDMCQAILDDVNWDEPKHDDGLMTVNPDLIKHMAVALYAIRPPQSSPLS